MRQAFIRTLVKEAEQNRQIFLLTGDLGFTVLEEFREKFPNRFINAGVAEQNMVGVAAGLALIGKVVFTYSIASFATLRPFEFIRNSIALHNLPVIIIGSGGGLCYSRALSTHYALEDVALMRTLPGMTVICPADKYEVKWAVKKSIFLKKPVYIRLGKTGEPSIYKKQPILELGKGKILKNGQDLAIIATGNIVANCLKAAEILADRGIEACVVSMHTVKPLDTNLINKISARVSLLVTVEEHYINGGLGSAVAESLENKGNHQRLCRLGVSDQFVNKIGSHSYLREEVGLSPMLIADKICNFL